MRAIIALLSLAAISFCQQVNPYPRPLIPIGGNVSIDPAITPSAPVVVRNGPAGSPTWTYALIGYTCSANGLNSSIGASTSITGTLAGIDMSISTPTTPARFLFYDVQLTAVGAGGTVGRIAAGLAPGVTFHDTTGIGDPTYLPQTVNYTSGLCLPENLDVTGLALLNGGAVIRNAAIPQDNGIKIPYPLAQGPVASSLGVGLSFTGDVQGPSALRGMVALDVETNITYTGSAPAQIKGSLQQGQFRTTVTPTIDGFIGMDSDFYFLGDVDGAALLGLDMFAFNDSATRMSQLIGGQFYAITGGINAGPTITTTSVGVDAQTQIEFGECTLCTAVRAGVSSQSGAITAGHGVDVFFDDDGGTAATSLVGINIGSPSGKYASIGTYNAIYQHGVSDGSTLEGFLVLGPHSLVALTALSLPDYAHFSCSDCKVTTVAANVVSNSTCAGSGDKSTGVALGGILKCDYRP